MDLCIQIILISCDSRPPSLAPLPWPPSPRTHAGRSSMAIQMQAWQDSEAEPWLQATFTFVGRSFETGKAVSINPLRPETAEEQSWFEHAANESEVKKAFRRLKAGKCTSAERNKSLTSLTAELEAQGQQAMNLPALVDPNYNFACVRYSWLRSMYHFLPIFSKNRLVLATFLILHPKGR